MIVVTFLSRKTIKDNRMQPCLQISFYEKALLSDGSAKEKES